MSRDGSRMRTSIRSGRMRPSWISRTDSPTASIRLSAVRQAASTRTCGTENASVRRGASPTIVGWGPSLGAGRLGDARRAALADVGEQLLGVQDAQRLTDGTALDAELLGQLGLGGQAVARLQIAGADAVTQGGGDLLGRLSSAAVHCHVLLGHDQTLQLRSIFGELFESCL